jgi:hypothetical protein
MKIIINATTLSWQKIKFGARGRAKDPLPTSPKFEKRKIGEIQLLPHFRSLKWERLGGGLDHSTKKRIRD